MPLLALLGRVTRVEGWENFIHRNRQCSRVGGRGLGVLLFSWCGSWLGFDSLTHCICLLFACG